MISDKKAGELLHLAESAALLAGAQLRSRRGEWREVTASAGRDVKIAADRNSEALIVERLAGSGIPLYSEEAGAIDGRRTSRRSKKATGPLWIIDPLDGSLNYHQGIPLCCVSIALYDGPRPILGVVYDFNHDEMFCGRSGRGAWLNHRPMEPSRTEFVSRAVLATGFPVHTDFSAPALSEFVGAVQGFRKVRLLGSAALSLCYVACGRVDAYREDGIMFWDVAAGCAVVEAAGGTVSVEKHEHPASPVHVLATNGRLSVNEIRTSQG
jgi:myo-inositol-1(or 4)-monophosphatase